MTCISPINPRALSASVKCLLLVSLALANMLAVTPLRAASFVYQGVLHEGAGPAQGLYDLRIVLFASAAGGLPLAGPIEVHGIDVRDGRFSVDLDLDLAPGAAGEGWLEVAVRGAGEIGHTPMSGRQKVSLGEPMCPEAWEVNGNAGTNPLHNFLGTTDAQPLELRVGDHRVARFAQGPGGPQGVNVLLGGSGNLLAADVSAATISGGNGNEALRSFTTIGGGVSNAASGPLATVGGGEGNQALDFAATVAGGVDNIAHEFASVGGGFDNLASGADATVAGGAQNRAIGLGSSVLGGNSNGAMGDFSAVTGGGANCAGADFSWVGGFRAKTRPAAGAGIQTGGCLDVPEGGPAGDIGSFVWSSSSGLSDFVSSGPNQFLVRAPGGFGLNTNQPRAALHVTDGASGAEPVANSILVAERSTAAFVHLLTPDAVESGLLMGGPGSGNSIRAAVVSDSGANLRLRSGGNLDRLVITASGHLQLLSLAAGGNEQVCRNAAGELATCSSRRDYKESIQPLGDVLPDVERLRPVSYRWRDTGAPDLGLIAEEVADILPALAARSEDGSVEGVRYERLAVLAIAALQQYAAAHEARAAALEQRLATIEARYALAADTSLDPVDRAVAEALRRQAAGR